MRFLIVVSMVFVAGCAVSQKRLNTMSDMAVCASYGEMRTNMFSTSAKVESYKKEMIRRELLNANEWSLVRNKQIQQGMSVCALKASWGFSSDREYVGAGKTVQHAFKCGVCKVPHAYVYSKNGVVTGWSK